VDFSKSFSRGESGEIWFLSLETKKTPICSRVGKVSATSLNNLGNFKRFNTIPNSEILLNLIRKLKYLTDLFQLYFCFCVANAK